jgi:hypothetical protein
MYEYAAMGHFQIAPLISMSGIPLVNQIPELGLGTGQFSMIFNDSTNGYWNHTGS